MSEQAKKAAMSINAALAEASEAVKNQVLAYAQGLAAGLSIAAQGRTPAGDAAERKE